MPALAPVTAATFGSPFEKGVRRAGVNALRAIDKIRQNGQWEVVL